METKSQNECERLERKEGENAVTQQTIFVGDRSERSTDGVVTKVLQSIIVVESEHDKKANLRDPMAIKGPRVFV